MSKPRVGRVLGADEVITRDAIHVPIMPVFADGQSVLRRGEAVRLLLDGTATQYDPSNDKHVFVGVVDPYLMDPVPPGGRFYLFLRPESTHRLWHEWTHPLIDGRSK